VSAGRADIISWFWKTEAKYFCGGGLDSVSRLEIAGEIRFFAHVILGVWAGSASRGEPEIAQITRSTVLPVGQRNLSVPSVVARPLASSAGL
jgi:hypothetical protein